jgi:hypothetical protein
MKKIIGFTDQITECECCGKTNLKGTYCLEIDGIELYYGSSCAFKTHGMTEDEQRAELSKFKAKDKLKAMEQDHDEQPTFNNLKRMTSFVIKQQKSVDTLAYFLKYGKETEHVGNATERHFHIPQTNQQIWLTT